MVNLSEHLSFDRYIELAKELNIYLNEKDADICKFFDVEDEKELRDRVILLLGIISLADNVFAQKTDVISDDMRGLIATAFSLGYINGLIAEKFIDKKIDDVIDDFRASIRVFDSAQSLHLKLCIKGLIGFLSHAIEDIMKVHNVVISDKLDMPQ